MKYYFIDTENVGDNGLEGIEKLKTNDKVILFVRQGNNLSKNIRRRIKDVKVNVEIKEFHTHTKNAMDFNIVAYLGYLVATDKSALFYIVSRDAGYQAAIEILKSIIPDVKIELISSICSNFFNISKATRRMYAIQKLEPLKNNILNDTDFEKVINICIKSENLSVLNNKLQHSFKKESCDNLYKIIKPYYQEIVKVI